MASRNKKNITTTTSEPLGKADVERPAFELSLTQMIAGTAAAVTAALLGSRLGVAGTIIGAALASMVSMIAGAIYSHSIRSAKHRVKIARVQHQGEPTPEISALPTGVLPIGSGSFTNGAHDDETALAFSQATPALMPLSNTSAMPLHTGANRPPATSIQQVPRAKSWRLPTMVMAGIGAVAAFGMSLILLTGIETVSGNPVSGGQPGGLTILGGQSTGQADNHDGGSKDKSTGSGEPAKTSTGGSADSTTTVTATVTSTQQESSSGSASSPQTPTGPSTAPSTGAQPTVSVSTGAAPTETAATQPPATQPPANQPAGPSASATTPASGDTQPTTQPPSAPTSGATPR